MPRKTIKRRRNRRRTLKRLRRKGGGDSQALKIPDAAFSRGVGSPVNSADPFYFK